MTHSSHVQEADSIQAAMLTAAMLRFQEPLAHPTAGATPAGMPVVGVDAYLFFPSPRPVHRKDVVAYLAALPGPAFIAATTMRGMYCVLLLEELSGDRRASMQHELDNQQAGVLSLAPGPDTDRVLLEFDEEAHVFTLAAIRWWSRRYGLTVGWNVQPCPVPERAEWRFNLFGGDGRRFSRGVGRA